jgi:hypothetical protein
MNNFDNVKLIFIDKENQFLVGEKYGTSHKYSLFGGHRDKKDNHWFVTAKRELEEESANLFSIEYTPEKKYEFIIDDLFTIPLDLMDIYKSKRKLYVIFRADTYFKDYIDYWRIQFGQFQDGKVIGRLFQLYDFYPDISFTTWLKLANKYSPRKDRLQKEFKSLGLGQEDIKYVTQIFEDISVHIENDAINVASLNELLASNGLYEREILEIL